MTILSKIERTTALLSGRILSLLLREKSFLHGRVKVGKWSVNSSPFSRRFNSEVQSIPEEYFDLGNFECKFLY